MMKKLVILLLLLACLTACAACGSAPAQTVSSPAAAVSPNPTPEAEQVPENTVPPETEDSPSEIEQEEKAVVVFFSATGNTRRAAEMIASLTGADLKEIVPAQPYTAEDLNYNDHSTRATVEQHTPDARPEIAEEIVLDGYTMVYLGYPIWWGDAPRIMDTFVESHDFSGMTVIPFCTSASSGAGTSGETLGALAGTGTFLPAARFGSSVSESALQTWLDGLSA